MERIFVMKNTCSRKCVDIKCKCGTKCLVSNCNPDWYKCFTQKGGCLKVNKFLGLKPPKIKAVKGSLE